MTDKFEQISNKPGFMKHNGDLFRKISDTEFEFKTTIDENKLQLLVLLMEAIFVQS